ncbi:hypothetical protein AVEN_73865-1 [Araneus ventricosus]|uniref:Uncharacterized protein n=1 Tax=Araneus ventricosus TaxID=182803 RepID=A0A4Y2GE72_ARAVE|nr:hypothetical protein AVEN_73865-1 [Araneus ventricosus]
MEQLRRCSKATSTQILLDDNRIATLNQERFLTDAKKTRLIALLTDKFKAVVICVKQAANGADALRQEEGRWSKGFFFIKQLGRYMQKQYFIPSCFFKL